MVSNLAPGSDFASLCPSCVSGDGQYIRAGGTSMSAPVVAGVVAALLEEHPTWTPDQVKGALVNNLRELPGGGDEVDALAAYNASKRELTLERTGSSRASSSTPPPARSTGTARAGAAPAGAGRAGAGRAGAPPPAL